MPFSQPSPLLLLNWLGLFLNGFILFYLGGGMSPLQLISDGWGRFFLNELGERGHCIIFPSAGHQAFPTKSCQLSILIALGPIFSCTRPKVIKTFQQLIKCTRKQPELGWSQLSYAKLRAGCFSCFPSTKMAFVISHSTRNLWVQIRCPSVGKTPTGTFGNFAWRRTSEIWAWTIIDCKEKTTVFWFCDCTGPNTMGPCSRTGWLSTIVIS